MEIPVFLPQLFSYFAKGFHCTHQTHQLPYQDLKRQNEKPAKQRGKSTHMQKQVGRAFAFLNPN
jgi:hypothetical protein